MRDIKLLVTLLEYRFKNLAYAEEKECILKLLTLYYPIMQRNMNRTVEIRESKMNFYDLTKECMHTELTKDKNSKFIYKCKNKECNKVIIK
jgi:hypothetical protein